MSRRHSSRRWHRSSDAAVTTGLRGITLVLACVLLLYYLVPLVTLWVSQSPGELLGNLSRDYVVTAATNSVLAAAVSTMAAVVFGLPLAYWLSRTGFRGQNVVLTVVILPLVLPPVVSGMLLLRVVGPAGIGTLVTIPFTRSLLGVVIAQLYVASPFLVVTAKTAFDGVDRQLEAASQSLGRGKLSTFRRVTLPLAKPGIIAGVTLTFARAIGEFGATLMMAYYPRTLPVQIWVSYLSTGLDAALPVALVLLTIAVGTVLLIYTVGTNPWQ